MTVGHNPTDRSKLGRTKRHILTDKNGIPISVVMIIQQDNCINPR